MRKFSCLAVFVLFVSSAFGGEVVEEIVARVNNQIITLTEFEHSKQELRKEAMQQDPVNADKLIAENDKDVLRDLIDQQLLLEKAKDLGINADTELVKKLGRNAQADEPGEHGRPGKGRRVPGRLV